MAQNYQFGIGASTLDPKELEGDSGAQHARDGMNEDNVFGPAGWGTTFFPKVRGDLYLMYDDGLFRDGMGSFQIDEEKFPFLDGFDAAQRMRKLNDRTSAAGWRGAALWCRSPVTGGDEADNFVNWSKYAGIEYWKIDGGDKKFAYIDIAKRLYPALKLEHVRSVGPFNGDWQSGEIGRFNEYQLERLEAQCLEQSDVFRTYDVSAALSCPTTLDRVAWALQYGDRHPLRALINCEDEVYIAATLGCTMGVMRNPQIGLRPAPDVDVFFTCPRQCKRRMDEVVRALRWQRLAQPFVRYGAKAQPGDATQVDDKILADSWTFQSGETWLAEAIGKTVRQGAPARVSRGLPLPEVVSDDEPPFVIAGRFPNGAVAVAVQGRTTPECNWTFSPADVTLAAGSPDCPIGVFGHYRNLTVCFDAALGAVRILAQDLAADRAEDITSEVIIEGHTLTLPGALIAKVGLRAASHRDISDPGLVLVIRKE